MNQRHETCPLCDARGYEFLSDYEQIELARCSSCGATFVSVIPTQEELIAHYEGYSREPAKSAISEQRREDLLDKFEPYRRKGRILDVGCGVGDLLNQARERGWETHGTEFTDEAIDVCVANRHSMQHGPLDSSNYPKASFDVIVYTEVIEHINNQSEEFEHVHRLLRPGGLVYITTPNFNSISRRLLGEKWTVIHYPEHLVYFTPETLTFLMKQKGFTQEWLTTTGLSPGRLVASLHRPTSHQAKDASFKPKPTASRKKGLDEAARQLTEGNNLGKAIKSAVNCILSLTESGDTIKAGFKKRRLSD